MRTEKQLGYVVNAGSMPILKTNGLVLTVESPGAHPLALENEIEAFRFINWEDLSEDCVTLPIDKLVVSLLKDRY